MSNTNQNGFTLIELFIVGIIVVILGTLVLMTHGGVEAKNRDTTREKRVTQLQASLETYYAKQTAYPSLQQINDARWRAKNLQNIDNTTIVDPQWKASLTLCTAKDQPTLAAKPTKHCYSYQPIATNGSNCASKDVVCAQYTLTALLEHGEKYVKNSLN